MCTGVAGARARTDGGVGCGGLGFPELTGFRVSELLRVWWSVRGCVCACLSTRPFVEFLVVSFGRSISVWLARSRSIYVFSAVFGRAVERKPPPLGVRCLFPGFMGVACFSSLVEITAVFVRLRLRRPPATLASDARQRRPPATPASDARQRRPPATPASGPYEATTRLETSGPCPKSLPHAPCNNHSTPRLCIPRNATKAYFFVVSDDGPASLLTGSPTGPVFWPLAL